MTLLQVVGRRCPADEDQQEHGGPISPSIRKETTLTRFSQSDLDKLREAPTHTDGEREYVIIDARPCFL